MKKLLYFVSGLIVVAAVLSVVYQPLLQAATSTITWEGIIPHIYTGATGDQAINIAMTASTTGLDVSEESSTTNALYEVSSLTYTTSGTPATGIGPKMSFATETSASHNETIGYVGFSVSDGTLDSEDGTFAVGNMAAGATAANKFTIGSTGIVTLAGSATLDNSTAATELNITETNIQLTGALDLEGGNVKINEDSGDYDFAIETDSTDNAFSIDSGNSTLETNGLTVTFNQGSADVDFIVESNDVATALKVDAGTNVIQHNTWTAYAIATPTAQSYSLASATRAGIVIQTVGEAASGHLMTDLLTSPGPGGIVIWKTGGANDVVLDTEGAEDIDGQDTYTLDGTYESVMLVNDGSNWFIIGPYLE